MLDDALTARIAATKRRLLDGGLLQEVEWGVQSGERDERGRVTITYTPLDALIEQRPALDRGTSTPTAPTIRYWSFSTRWQSPTSTHFDGVTRRTPTRSKPSMGLCRTKTPARDTTPKSW